MKKYTDQEIIQGLKSGESFAVKYLAKELLPVISYFISKNNGDEENAKDVFQDALFIIIEKILKNNFEVQGALSTYIFAICKHLWLIELDRQKAAKNYEVRREAESAEIDFSEAGDCVFYENVFRKCFDAMDDISQKILKMYWLEISPSEIAETLGYSYGYVRKKKSECMKELKNRIMEHPDFKELEKNLNIK
ncbi:MAG: sigma-70 family RNA polymerase sigma factor [Bacteroidia bacterium]|nr:sigma-70 family RNA polymerase sigma factor [Bacteroidia bacterium]